MQPLAAEARLSTTPVAPFKPRGRNFQSGWHCRVVGCSKTGMHCPGRCDWEVTCTVIACPDVQAFYANENASIPNYDALPERKVIRSDYDNVFEDSNWWTSGDESGANTFLTMPYFPFLSSCAGYGNHMSFAKLVESHPDCTLVSEEVASLLPLLIELSDGDGQVKRGGGVISGAVSWLSISRRLCITDICLDNTVSCVRSVICGVILSPCI